MTHTFVSADLMNKTHQNIEQAYKIRNALSPDLNFYRMSALPSLINHVHANHKLGFKQFAVFETTKIHNKVELVENDLPLERMVTAFCFSAVDTPDQQSSGSAFYQAKYFLNALVDSLDIKISYRKLSGVTVDDNAWLVNLCRIFEPSRSAVVFAGDEPIGAIGEFRAAVRKNFKLPMRSAGFEFDTNIFVEIEQKKTYKQLSKYPSVDVDITYETNTDTSFEQIESAIKTHLNQLDISTKLMPTDIFRPEDKSCLRYSFNLKITSFENTLTSTNVQDLLKNLDKKLAEQVNAQRV